MSILDNKIAELTRMVGDLELKSLIQPNSPPNFEGLKKKTVEIEQYVITLEADISEILNKLRENRIDIPTRSLTPDLVFEDKKYDDPEFSKLILDAAKGFHSTDPERKERVLKWVPEAEDVEFQPYDLMVGIYVLSQKKSLGASASSLQNRLKGAMSHGQITTEAHSLGAEGYVLEQKRRSSKKKPGKLATYYKLTPDGIKRLLKRTRTLSEEQERHRAMEMKRVMRAFRKRPPDVYLPIEQHQDDRDRSDAFVLKRESKDTLGDIVAVNIETPKDVENHEDEVYRRMVSPFAFGAQRLEIIYHESSWRTLTKLKKQLPGWLSDKIII
jgi:DNA-binding PadR family transcriptional regulator